MSVCFAVLLASSVVFIFFAMLSYLALSFLFLCCHFASQAQIKICTPTNQSMTSNCEIQKTLLFLSCYYTKYKIQNSNQIGAEMTRSSIIQYIRRIQTESKEHLQTNNMTYKVHFYRATNLASTCLKCFAMLTVHAVCPAFFQNNSSHNIRDMYWIVRTSHNSHNSHHKNRQSSNITRNQT